MGGGINSEDLEDIQESLSRSGFIQKVVSFPYRVISFIFDCIFYGPGVGSVSTKKISKHRVCKVSTSMGNITVPIVKMPAFDLTFGFFLEYDNISTGLIDTEDFLAKRKGSFPKSIKLSNIETYWLLNYRRPKDVHGKKKIFCYINNQLDGLIYIHKIENNDLIDYEKILDTYELEIENLDFIENVENEIVTIQNTEEFLKNLGEDEAEETEGLRKRIKVEGVCFNGNCTNIPRSENL